jgi:hypothetical protein
MLACAALFASGGATFGAEPPSSAPGAPSAPAVPSTSTEAEMEARLAAARSRLDKAAQEVAELSMRLATVGEDRAFQIASGMQRGVIGLQLDPAS